MCNTSVHSNGDNAHDCYHVQQFKRGSCRIFLSIYINVHYGISSLVVFFFFFVIFLSDLSVCSKRIQIPKCIHAYYMFMCGADCQTAAEWTKTHTPSPPQLPSYLTVFYMRRPLIRFIFHLSLSFICFLFLFCYYYSFYFRWNYFRMILMMRFHFNFIPFPRFIFPICSREQQHLFIFGAVVEMNCT